MTIYNLLLKKNGGIDFFKLQADTQEGGNQLRRRAIPKWKNRKASPGQEKKDISSNIKEKTPPESIQKYFSPEVQMDIPENIQKVEAIEEDPGKKTVTLQGTSKSTVQKFVAFIVESWDT